MSDRDRPQRNRRKGAAGGGRAGGRLYTIRQEADGAEADGQAGTPPVEPDGGRNDRPVSGAISDGLTRGASGVSRQASAGRPVARTASRGISGGAVPAVPHTAGSAPAELPPVVLKSGEEDRLLKGHPWIYDNEIASSAGVSDGSLCRVHSAAGKYLGFGYCNSRSRIRVRMLHIVGGEGIFGTGVPLTAGTADLPVGDAVKAEPPHAVPTGADVTELLRMRFRTAIAKRERIVESDARRLVFSESDGLPGLIADLYGDTLVIQITTLGMDMLRDNVVAILDDLLTPRVIYEKSLSPIRSLEGLKPVARAIKGSPEPVMIRENGLFFLVDPVAGGKTGFYLDQRDNRRRLDGYCEGRSVLDTFCFTGGFSVYALRYGAVSVLGIDENQRAVDTARRNIRLNNPGQPAMAGEVAGNPVVGVLSPDHPDSGPVDGDGGPMLTDRDSPPRVEFLAADVFETMRLLVREGRIFDLVILDPPPFSRSRGEHTGAMKGYRDLHAMALKLLPVGGVLFTFTCSRNVSMAELIGSVKRAAKAGGCRVRVLEQMFQAKDHPYSTLVPESFYLKGVVIRKEQV